MRLNIVFVVLLVLVAIVYAGGTYKHKENKVDKKAFHKEDMPSQVCLDPLQGL